MELEEKGKEITAQQVEEITMVGIGASAGGLEALQELISHLPANLDNMAIVIAQHLSPTYKSMLVQLLSRQTQLEVVEISNRMPVKINRIYITPPDSEITLIKGYFHLKKPAHSAGPKPSVDVFFQSLAEDRRAKCIGIILSGTGTDGASGIRAIKEAGGITIAQEPQTAKYDGMPIAAIETGYVDFVLAPDKIGEELKELLEQPSHMLPSAPLDEKDSSVDKILRLLSKRTGTDFSNYKPSTICRRLEKRIAEKKLTDIESYLSHIEENPAELDELFNNILIGVTTFFRDTEAFDALERHLGRILSTKRKGDAIRIWIPGCATGEEAYSIAMLVAKLLKNRLADYNVQIFATDIDEKAIAKARRGIYAKEALEFVPSEILNDYLLKANNKSFEVIKSIRQLILFSKHDVTNNPPFLKLDLISCRNLLIYFSQNLQKHVIPIFHYALNTDGYLFLGKSETVGQFTDLFLTLEGKAKIFQRKRGNYIHNIKFSAFKPKVHQYSSSQPARNNQRSIPDMVKETFYNTFEHCYVIVNDDMDVLEINGDVRMYLSIQPGSMNANILKMANSDLQIELRSTLSKAIKDRTNCKGNTKRVSFFGKEIIVRIVVKPLLYTQGDNNLFLVIFEQQEVDESLQNLARSANLSDGENPRILELEHELAGTKEHLQTFVEELETANEELQSLNEELQSSNEELQSSNEELETSNEELQSTNEELQIAYSELKSATEEIEKQALKARISEANANALLNNSLQAFILVNRDYRIISFNQKAAQITREIFGRGISQGDSMIDLQFSGELEQFHRDFKKCLNGEQVHGERKVIVEKNQATKWFVYHYTPVTNDDDKVEVISYSYLDVTDQKRIEQELTESEQLINSVFNAADIGICVTNEDGCFVKVNQVYCELYGYSMDELIGKPFTMVLPEEQWQHASELHTKFLQGHPESAGLWEVQKKSGELFKARVTAARMVAEGGKKFKVTTVSPIDA